MSIAVYVCITRVICSCDHICMNKIDKINTNLAEKLNHDTINKVLFLKLMHLYTGINIQYCASQI